MALAPEIIAQKIDEAPLNRGLRGRDWLAFQGNVPVSFDNGDVVLFDYEGYGDYEIHVLFESRGRQAVEHAREAITKMFYEYGARLIFGLVPEFRRDVKLLARWVGMKFVSKQSTPFGECDLFVVSHDMWKVS